MQFSLLLAKSALADHLTYNYFFRITFYAVATAAVATTTAMTTLQVYAYIMICSN